MPIVPIPGRQWQPNVHDQRCLDKAQQRKTCAKVSRRELSYSNSTHTGVPALTPLCDVYINHNRRTNIVRPFRHHFLNRRHYECDICHKSFARKYRLKTHYMSYHRIHLSKSDLKLKAVSNTSYGSTKKYAKTGGKVYQDPASSIAVLRKKK